MLNRCLTRLEEVRKDRVTSEGEVMLNRCLTRLEEVRKEESAVNVGSDIGPITYYTSSLQVKDSDNRSYVLYGGLNQCLRETNMGMVQQMSADKRWKYLFAANLIKCLSQLQDYREGERTLVYRAIKKHKLIGEVGEVY